MTLTSALLGALRLATEGCKSLTVDGGTDPPTFARTCYFYAMPLASGNLIGDTPRTALPRGLFRLRKDLLSCK